MKIEKYKYLSGGRYKVFIDNETYIIYEDIIIKYNILGKKEITKEELAIYLKDNNYYESYYKVLNYIGFRIRSKKEVKNYLDKNNCSKSYINKIIEKLENEGYVNDTLFSNYYVADSINLKNVGPLKIKKELQKHDISDDIIIDALEKFTKEIQYEKIKKLISKKAKLNKNKSLYNLKQKIIIDLVNEGFYKEDILMFLYDIQIDEISIYEKEYNKLYNKLSRKYEGYELEQKIKQKLYQKGLYK